MVVTTIFSHSVAEEKIKDSRALHRLLEIIYFLFLQHYLLLLIQGLLLKQNLVLQHQLIDEVKYSLADQIINLGKKVQKKIAPLGETLPKKHHQNFTLNNAKIDKLVIYLKI